MLRFLDVFPKAMDSELSVRTNTGGILTLIAVSIFGFFIVTECHSWEALRSDVGLVLHRGSLPPTIPIWIFIDVYNNCSNLHGELTNPKRSLELDTVISSHLTQNGSFCQMKFQMIPPTVPASFHIGLGNSYVDPKTGAHTHMWLTLPTRNLSHRIRSVRFGEIEMPSPLDNIQITLKKPATYMLTYALALLPQYDVKRVGYQISPSLTKVNLDKMRDRAKGIPAIIFQWTFSPMAFERTVKSEPVINLVCGLLGFAGVFFVFVRILDGLVFTLNEKLSKTST
jgi:hypothetical protein